MKFKLEIGIQKTQPKKDMLTTKHLDEVRDALEIPNLCASRVVGSLSNDERILNTSELFENKVELYLQYYSKFTVDEEIARKLMGGETEKVINIEGQQWIQYFNLDYIVSKDETTGEIELVRWYYRFDKDQLLSDLINSKGAFA